MPEYRYECFQITNENKKREFWVHPWGSDAISIVKDGDVEILEDEGRTYRVERHFGVNHLNELGPIAGDNGIVKTLMPVDNEHNLTSLKEELKPGSRRPLHEVSQLYDNRNNPRGPKGAAFDNHLLRSYVRQYAIRERQSGNQNNAKPNTALTVKLTEEAARSGLKEHLIFGLEDPPKIRKENGRMWIDSDVMPLEVLSIEKLIGMEEIKAYVERYGKEKCQMMASNPGFNDRVFAYDDSPEAIEELTDKMIGRYALSENPLLQEPWGAQHAIKPESIFIVTPEPRDKMESGEPFEGLYAYEGATDERWGKYGLSILQPTCLSGYDRTIGLVIYSVYKATGKKAMDAIRDQMIIKDAQTGEPVPSGIDNANSIERDFMRTLQEESAMQTMTTPQWKALRSWLKTPEESRRHAVLKADIGGSFFQDVLKDAEDDPEAKGMPLNIAARFLSYMMLTLLQGRMGHSCQLFFIMDDKPSEEWKRLAAEQSANGDALPQKRMGDVFKMLADDEIHIMVLPGTQADSFEAGKLEGTGFQLVQEDEERRWIDTFLRINDGYIKILSLTKENEPLKEERNTATENRNEQIAIVSGTDVIWNDGLIAERGADILSNSLSIHPEKTDDTVLSIPPGSRLMKRFSSYGTHGKDGWHIAAGDGIPLSETLDHAGFIGRLFEDHIAGITELRRLTSTGQADMSVNWNGEEHRPGRPEDPIRFVTSFEVDDVIEDDMKDGESIASLIGDGRLRCGFIWRPDLGIRLNMLSSPPDMFFDDLEYLVETPDIIMMRAVGQNPSRTAFKKMMADLERFELRTDAVETVEAVLESDTDLEIPRLAPMDHPVEITSPKGTLFALVEDVVLLPNGKKPPKAYVSIWSADMKGKYKAVLDRIPEELERRISVLLMMMRSDEKILEVIESLPDGRNGRSTAASGGKKQNGTRSVKTVSLTREFRHRIMREKTEHTPVPRSTEGKILADVSVRKHLRLQPYGPGRSMRKLITIESYAKKMFVNPGVQTTRVIR